MILSLNLIYMIANGLYGPIKRKVPLRNLFRRKKRSAITIVTIAISMILIISSISVMSSFFQSIDEETKGVITWGASQVWEQERDFETSDREGSIFLLQLPVGDYEIYDYQFYWNGGMAERSYMSADGLAIPFKVTENEITYLGEFLAWGRRAKNAFGMTIVAGGSFTWEGRPERDYELIDARYPAFDASKAELTDLSAYFPPPELVKKLNVPSD